MSRLGRRRTGRIAQQKTPSVAGGVFGSNDASGSARTISAHPAIGGGRRETVASDAAHVVNIAIGGFSGQKRARRSAKTGPPPQIPQKPGPRTRKTPLLRP